MKKFVIFIIGTFIIISAFYFTANSQTVLELALWCLFFTVLFSLIIAYVNKAEYKNSLKEALIDNISYSVLSGIVCFGGVYFYLF
jgi:divalent metal cation (Fe/Co/Zn/Cd) transporter